MIGQRLLHVAAVALLAVALSCAVVRAETAPVVAHTISASAVSARNSVAFTQPLLAIYSDDGFWYRLGDSSVTATTSDFYSPPGVMITVERGSGTERYLAVISTVATTVYITELR